ncbi:hypothetical protein ACSVH2_11130 [Flavobacterium sp. RSB2_4_14]|uniref:hypothetical protein n=1 Tax=Flavobacterium sp. RSB2_4_14 TaxID=3447665 RepID=UPI003F319D42
MKKVILIFCVFSLLSCKSKKTIATEAPKEKRMVILIPAEVDVAKKNRAYDLGKRLIETCNTSRFKAFNSSEATEKVRQNATAEKISATCKKINQRNGKFIALNLIDVTHDEFNDEYIFRYAIDYEKKLFKRELKVTVTTDNKVSAIATQEIKAKPM